MTLGEKLKEARRRAGLSQEQLADQLYISRSAVAKWEADLGLPDVENLNTLAQTLYVSADNLLDQTAELSQSLPRSTPDPTPFCGKSCKACTHAASLQCPGCKFYPHTAPGGCAIARCCGEKGLVLCSECGYRQDCNRLVQAAQAPDQRLQALRRAENRQKHALEEIHFTARWIHIYTPLLRRLLPVLSPAALLWIALTISAIFPDVPTVLGPLALLPGLAYGGTLLALAPAQAEYRRGGILTLLSLPFGVLTGLGELRIIPWLTPILFLALFLLLNLLARRHIFSAHTALTTHFSNTLARRWQLFRKWDTIVTILCLVFPAGALLLLTIPFVGAPAYGYTLSALPLLLLAVELWHHFCLIQTVRLFWGRSAEDLHAKAINTRFPH